MEQYTTIIRTAAEAIEKVCGKADIGIVLGSGLGDYVEALENPTVLNYADIPHFPVSTVHGHAGRFCSGILHGKRVLMMQGRFHAYEGYDMKEVTLPIRVMKELGIEKLIVTNAAGGVNLDFKPGDLMVISDFLNFSGKNPLTGPNLEEYGVRFPDMSYAYDVELQQVAEKTGKELGIHLTKGVYCWFNGPSFETPAEIRMARVLGADAVGMSTVPETIVARHMGMKVLGISCITNMAAGILPQPLSHEEVNETSAMVKDTFRNLVDGIVERM